MLETYIIRVCFAALIGGLIGLEREYRDKSAGFRTMILIAVGSAIFTIFSITIGTKYGTPDRIASSIVTGVGFLGAGVILREGIRVRGLTTAASIWLVAALGMGMGNGEIAFTGTVGVAMLLILFFLPPFERMVDAWHDFINFKITIKNTDKAEEKLLKIFETAKVRVVHINRIRANQKERTLYVQVKTTRAKHAIVDKMLVNEKSIVSFTLVGAE